MRLCSLALVALLISAAAPARAGDGSTCVAPPDGLVSWWRGEGDAADAQGTNPGSAQNGVTFPTGRVGMGFGFDGVDDVITVPDDASLTPRAAFTLSAWFQTAALADPRAAFIAARSGPDGLSGYELDVRDTGTARVLRFTLNGGSAGADLMGTTEVADGALHHVAASYDGTKMRIHLDGVLEAELVVAVDVDYPEGSPFLIGRREFDVGGIPGPWTGVIDEVQLVSGRALCASEIAAIAAAGAAGQCEGGPEPVCLDAFLCYKAKPTKGGLGFEPQQTALDGPFESLAVALSKPQALCLPAGLDGAAPENATTHLQAYKAKPTTAPFRPTGVVATTAFGSQTLDTVKVDRVLAPSLKGLTEPPLTPDPGQIDFFQCYTVKGSKGAPNFPKGVQAAVVEQFEAERTLDLKKPKRVCLAVGGGGLPLAQPLARLLCYPVKPAKGSPKHTRRSGVFVANELATHQVDSVKEEQLCVPATVPLVQ